ncbi:MAG: hypothetical protein HY702_02315 [Gemmatimonadetes bacterium]|nr:hypothetical protein [Gemmatimonadota bacterium]
MSSSCPKSRGLEFGDRALERGLLAFGHADEGLPHPPRQLLGQERLHFVAFEVEKPVDAEVEVGEVELEELAEEVLESLQRRHGVTHLDDLLIGVSKIAQSTDQNAGRPRRLEFTLDH